jgi:hypothetical protein
MSRREHEKNPFIFPTSKYSIFIISKVIEVIRCVLLSSLSVPTTLVPSQLDVFAIFPLVFLLSVWEVQSAFTVKKGCRFSRPQPGCH